MFEKLLIIDASRGFNGKESATYFPTADESESDAIRTAWEIASVLPTVDDPIVVGVQRDPADQGRPAARWIVLPPADPEVLDCHLCGGRIIEDDEVWIVPTTGEASVERGEPYHPECAPSEDPADEDEFVCESCGERWDIEDSYKRGGEYLCPECAWASPHDDDLPA